MEPRIAGSVSTNATDTQESPQGTGLVTAGITPQLFPGPILLAERRATAFFFIIILNSLLMSVHVSKQCLR